jgi:hypothetical protein
MDAKISYGWKRSKYLEKIQVSLALFVSFKIHRGDDLLVFDPEANNVLL